VTDELNILVIDDDDALRSLLVDIVTKSGHVAVPASSAEQGLELLPYWTFQVALLDQHLPGMEGLVIGEYLRRNNPDMTIALVTGEHDPRLPKKTKDLSIQYIKKPFDVNEIRDVFAQYQEAARAREERRLAGEDADFAPPIARFVMDLGESYEIPGVPERIEERLTATIKRCLFDLRSVGRYTERNRVLALAGLITARVLGIDLPRLPSGRTPFEEYDALMREHGRRTEFDEGAG
jgi:CheY-like chemotaxis protein